MSIIKDTDDYEKSFVVKYLKTQADKKIAELESKLENTTDSFKRLQIRREIKVVEQALELELKKLDGEEQTIEMFELGSKAKEIGVFVHNDAFIYGNFRIPMNAWNYLFDYQKLGVMWMLDLFELEKGGILADEMGLGKTIQVCTAIVSLFYSKKAEQFLILAPATIIDHWVDQLRKLEPCPKIYKKLSIKSKGIFVLSYESFRLCNILPTFDVVFLDEGHKIKNKESLISQSAKRMQARCRFVITGTPIQNNLAELWSIFDFVNPNVLGSYSTFQDEFERKIKHCKTEKEKQISYQYSVMLRSIIEPFILRRMKASVNHILPSKLDKVIFISLTDKQLQMYLEALKSKKFEILIKSGFGSKGSLLSALVYLRKICNHPLLVGEKPFVEYSHSDSSDSGNPDLQNASVNQLINDSSKLKVTFDMLDQWYSEKNRVLLFFQTYKMLQIAKMGISSFRPDFKFIEMSGKTPTSKRSTIINTFNNDHSYFIFLLTTRVGGLGLNLTGANRIVIYDPDWNPSTDSQAKERIYRYGQKSKVEIYRLVCRDTIEEKIYQKQIYKDCLSKKILSNPNANFDRDYFLDLFDIHSSFKKDAQVAESKEFTVENDELVSIKEEDKRDFNIFKALNSKTALTGKELIDYIKRRESNLSE
ncbi:uncharacterized protein VICG_00487 [Vittaforma corneae ATCC 50505]|uniref:Uncharacterized protein n=1 Tax=Vittaforma corneae (strain ATCC 50505) TaxID=993615 RepID=L2GNB1_VITCO|nr:uncharacterized protein VICG_00487 [Vittaforma corneae ATCC 50505]ELA42388.1 hypothetical protein VICG_00487 [Vittaforma corneae ATCC 50505]